MDEFWSVTVPSWLTGVGTLGLAALAFATMQRERAERRVLRAEANTERERADRIQREALEAQGIAADRAQAEQVVVYSDTAPDYEEDFISDGPNARSGARSRVAVIVNESPLPIHSVNIMWCYPEGHAAIETRNVPLVPPRSRKKREWPRSFVGRTDEIPLEIDFADARGVHWKRDRDGNLTRLDPYEPAS